MYNVFVDHGLREIAFFAEPSAYDASAIANHFVDSGFSVDTDLWDATVPDAMMSPATYEKVANTFPALPARVTLVGIIVNR